MSLRVATLQEIGDAFAYESITVTDVAVSLTSTVYALTAPTYCKGALLTLEAGQCRFRMDGVAPLADEGHLFEVGQNLRLTNPQQVKNFKIIRTGTTSGVLRVTYFK